MVSEARMRVSDSVSGLAGSGGEGEGGSLGIGVVVIIVVCFGICVCSSSFSRQLRLIMSPNPGSPHAPLTPVILILFAAKVVVNAVFSDDGMAMVSAVGKGARSGCVERYVRRRFGREECVRTEWL